MEEDTREGNGYQYDRLVTHLLPEPSEKNDKNGNHQGIIMKCLDHAAEIYDQRNDDVFPNVRAHVSIARFMASTVLKSSAMMAFERFITPITTT